MSLAHQLHAQSSPSEGWRGCASARVAELLEKGIEEGMVRGGIVLAVQHGRIAAQIGRGVKVAPKGASQGDSVSFETVFDLGALTESVCTASLLMRLISAGKIGASDRASRFVQALGVGQKSHITLAHLLSHTAGFPSSTDVCGELVRVDAGSRPGILASSGARNYAYSVLHKVHPRHEPGSRQTRSDINYIMLGEICEIVTGMPLEKAFSRFIAGPLGLQSLNFIDLTLVRSKNMKPVVEVFAPVGECARRGRFVCGEVWDENAWAMGGVAGHSGLFGTADDLLVWAQEILNALKGRSEIIAADVARSFVAPYAPEGEHRWRLGFEGRVLEGEDTQDIDPLLITSETGCSVLIDPKRDLAAVVLMSGGFAGGVTKRYAAMRGEIHAALLGME